MKGTYYVPAMGGDDKKRDELCQKGPIGFVHVTREGAGSMPLTMAKGFGVMLVGSILLALMMRKGQALGYVGRLMIAVWAGLAAAVLMDGGDVAWWNISPGWKLYQGFYDFSAFVVAGLILAAFTGTKKSA